MTGLSQIRKSHTVCVLTLLVVHLVYLLLCYFWITLNSSVLYFIFRRLSFSFVWSFRSVSVCRVGKQFEVTLLLQSVVMIVAMFVMLHLCCLVQNTSQVGTKQHRISGKRQTLSRRVRSSWVLCSEARPAGNASFSPQEGDIGQAKMAKLLFLMTLISCCRV